jgi:hypothetical protein
MLTPNTHIHTPYSFSSFDSIDQAADAAVREDVRVLGVSDFNTIAGFDEFAAACASRRIYPLYNIEFIAFSESDKQAGRRWNDPANPGVMYFCGKALAHPSSFGDDSRNRLKSLWKGTQDLIWRVIIKLNDHLAAVNLPISLDYNSIRSTYAKGTVRERHVARALADALRTRYAAAGDLLGALRTIFGDPKARFDTGNDVALQNELRNRLLKAGKPAYVEEDRAAFLSPEDVRAIVLDGGGIPCYPVLVDEKAGLSEYESDPQSLAKELGRRGFHAVEFIPTRNDISLLKRYVRVLRESGMCVTFGTEHNTPGVATLVPMARGNTAFDEELRAVSYEGACILAAHQKCVAEGKPGFVDRRGCCLVGPEKFAEFAKLGGEVIAASLV